MKKRICSILLTLAMTVSLLPVSALAAEHAAGEEEFPEMSENAENEDKADLPDVELPEMPEVETDMAESSVEVDPEAEDSDLLYELDEVMELLEGPGILATREVAGEDIAEYAMRFIGYPYVYATQGPNSFDCSGFVYYVFSHFGIYMTAASSYYWNYPSSYGTVVPEEDALPGDIVSWYGHVGIYIGDGKMVHAANESLGVCTGVVKNFRKDGVSNPPHHFIRVRGVTHFQNDVTAPVISNVRISSISRSGYTVTCTVTDDQSGVTKVQFPTWTTAPDHTGNAQDDLITDWETNPACSGNASDTIYTFRVKTSSHNYETGNYVTHIYAYDRRGNYSTYECNPVVVEDDMFSPVAAYCVHMQTYSWLPYVTDGFLAGVTGESKRMEAVMIDLQDPDGIALDPSLGGVTYKAHVQTYGWMDWVTGGQIAGTYGESKRVEALQIKLTGELAENYDIYYRAHAQHFGWLGWAKNGQSSGTAGYAYRLEAIQIMILPKGEAAPGATADAFCNADGHAHDYVAESTKKATCTTPGVEEKSCFCGAKQTVKLKALGHDYDTEVLQEPTEETPGIRKLTCKRCQESHTEEFGMLTPHVTYYTHCQTYGDLSWVMDGALSGTTGESKRLESIYIKLVDPDGKAIDPAKLGVSYRVHCQTYAWLDWVKNGEMGGTAGEAKRMEAMEIKLTGELADQYDIYYCVHSQTYGWLGWAKNGQDAGTSGLAKRLEALYVVITEKGAPAPASIGTETRAYINESML